MWSRLSKLINKSKFISTCLRMGSTTTTLRHHHDGIQMSDTQLF